MDSVDGDLFDIYSKVTDRYITEGISPHRRGKLVGLFNGRFDSSIRRTVGRMDPVTFLSSTKWNVVCMSHSGNSAKAIDVGSVKQGIGTKDDIAIRTDADEAAERFPAPQARDTSTASVSNRAEKAPSTRSYSLGSGDAGSPPSPRPAPEATPFQALQEWEGYVVEINDDEFVACLIDLAAGHSHESEEAIIPLIELSEHDRVGIEIGGIFRWVIGYECSPQGNQEARVVDPVPRSCVDDRRRFWARQSTGT